MIEDNILNKKNVDIPQEYLSTIPTIESNWDCKSLTNLPEKWDLPVTPISPDWSTKNLISVLRAKQLTQEKIKWYKKLLVKLDPIFEYEDPATSVARLQLYYNHIKNKIKKLELETNLKEPENE